MQEVRPKIILKLTNTDKVLEGLGWFVLVAIWIFTLKSYTGLPQTIPTHFDAAGKADGYGGKANIFLFAGIATLLYVGLTVLNRFPHIFNFPTKITVENALRQYTLATKMIRYLKLGLVVIFSLIIWETIRNATGESNGLGIWLLPFSLSLIFVPLIFFLIQMFRTK